MHWTMTQLAKWAGLSAEEHDRALYAAAGDARNFGSGYGVVGEHGRLTALGAGLIAKAKSYMGAAV